jgi:uncharacterized repeat protein (TIGR01451 family)
VPTDPPPPVPPAAPVPPPSPSPSPTPSEAPRDLEIERSQVPVLGNRPTLKGTGTGTGQEGSALPPAAETPGRSRINPGVPAGSAADAAVEASPFVLPATALPLGRQSVSLSVDVVGPAVVNLNQVATLKIVVRNTGTSDAMGVVVRDELPESLALLSSQPEAEQGSDRLLFWKLNTLAAGAQRDILVKVKTIKTGEINHAATVTMLAGSRSRTIVREPKLKVEQTATPGKVLKGQAVQFKIAVTNTGDGPARNVVLRAKLSPGLRVDSPEPNDQNLFEQTLDQLDAGQRLVLDPLVADTVAAGEQTCRVDAQSTDVTTSGDDARCVANVTVVEPKLKLAISGEDKRFTDTIATYNITVENPGTATAHNVRVLATLPLSGRLVSAPPSGAGNRWDPSSGKLLWTIPQVEPGENEKVTLTFQVRMGAPGFYSVTAEARGDGGLSPKAALCKTEVLGLVDLEFEVLEQRRVVDVNDFTAFKIRIKNIGTKDATNLLVRATLSKNIVPDATSGNDGKEAKWNEAESLVVFPPIDRLAVGKETVLGIKVQAKDKGFATCRVYLVHDEQDEPLEDMAAFKITPLR